MKDKVLFKGKFKKELYENKEDLLSLTHPKIDLRDAHAIRREMASIYRDARSGKIVVGEATRLCYILDLLRKAFEADILQNKLQILEKVMGSNK